MDELNPLASALPSANAGRNLEADDATLADNFETFLTLLTEQLANQDPLDPLDSNQFVEQLVQFSSVEQQIASNQSLQALLDLQGATAQLSAADYVGKVVTASSSEALLGADGANWSYSLDRPAQRTDLVISDSRGEVVASFPGETGDGAAEFVWDGRDQFGNALPEGVYSLEVVATDAEDEPIDTAVRVSGRVNGADFAGEEVTLDLGGLTVPLTRVIGVREAETG